MLDRSIGKVLSEQKHLIEVWGGEGRAAPCPDRENGVVKATAPASI